MLRKLAYVLVGLLVIAVAGHEVLQFRTASTRPAIDADAGYDVLRTIPVRGTSQWIQIRGKNRDNPLLLFLHGGPGAPMMALGPQFQNRWESDFNVVHWDQRGSGKTYFEQDTGQPTFDDMLADAEAVVSWLREYSGQQKIYLLGHSWGTALGSPLVMKHPEWFHSYFATGMFVRGNENESVGYARTLQIAREREDTAGISALERIAPYPLEDGSLPHTALLTLRKWQTRYGVGFSHKLGDSSMTTFLAYGFASPDYTLEDFSFFFRDLSEQWAPITRELAHYDISDYGTAFEVPVVFLLGRHDWQTPSTIAEAFFWHELEAPHKRLVWLESSAHFTFMDEPEIFARELRSARSLAH